MSDLDDAVIADIHALLAGMPAEADPGEGARFWKTLSAKHVALLREFGFANFKRTLNFEYSQWGITSFRSPVIRRLARTLLRDGLAPVGGLAARYDLSDRAGVRWPDGIDLNTGEPLTSNASAS